MNLEEIESIFLAKEVSVKEFPFGPEVMVFKVMNKMFGLISLDDDPLRVNLKATPDDCLAYRDIYECVIEGYHMNKKHWNTIIMDGSIPKEVFVEMVDESYDLVVSKLTKAQKEELWVNSTKS